MATLLPLSPLETLELMDRADASDRTVAYYVRNGDHEASPKTFAAAVDSSRSIHAAVDARFPVHPA